MLTGYRRIADDISLERKTEACPKQSFRITVSKTKILQIEAFRINTLLGNC